MVQMLSKVKEKIAPARVLLTNILLQTSLIMTGAYAASAVNVSDVNIEGANELVSTMLGVITEIARYIGILLAAWGIVQLVMAFKNEDADSKSRAMMLIVASIVLISARSLVTVLLGSVN